MSLKLSSDTNLEKFNTLACVDGSYVLYHTLFSAVNKWIEESEYSDIIENVDVSDPNFQQVDITEYPDFHDIAKGKLIEAFNKITRLIKDFNTTIASSTYGQIMFILDPEHGIASRSWRYKIYPEYKGKRADNKNKKPYKVDRIFNNLITILREDDTFTKRFNIRIISADNAEADDIIATIFMDDESKDFKKFLISSDKDFLQLSDVTQMNLEGKQIEIEQPYPDLIKMTPETFLLTKIIIGDESDNIPQLFYRVGYKTAIKKYIMEPKNLTESLESDKVLFDKFNLNTRLIDFNRIPKKIKAIAKKAIAL